MEKEGSEEREGREGALSSHVPLVAPPETHILVPIVGERGRRLWLCVPGCLCGERPLHSQTPDGRGRAEAEAL